MRYAFPLFLRHFLLNCFGSVWSLSRRYKRYVLLLFRVAGIFCFNVDYIYQFKFKIWKRCIKLIPTTEHNLRKYTPKNWHFSLTFFLESFATCANLRKNKNHNILKCCILLTCFLSFVHYEIYCQELMEESIKKYSALRNWQKYQFCNLWTGKFFDFAQQLKKSINIKVRFIFKTNFAVTLNWVTKFFFTILSRNSKNYKLFEILNWF